MSSGEMMEGKLSLLSDVQPLTMERAGEELALWADEEQPYLFMVWTDARTVYTAVALDHMSISRNPRTRDVGPYVRLGVHDVFFQDITRIQVFRMEE